MSEDQDHKKQVLFMDMYYLSKFKTICEQKFVTNANSRKNITSLPEGFPKVQLWRVL